jgi:hypothetical protein
MSYSNSDGSGWVSLIILVMMGFFYLIFTGINDMRKGPSNTLTITTVVTGTNVSGGDWPDHYLQTEAGTKRICDRNTEIYHNARTNSIYELKMYKPVAQSRCVFEARYIGPANKAKGKTEINIDNKGTVNIEHADQVIQK